MTAAGSDAVGVKAESSMDRGAERTGRRRIWVAWETQRRNVTISQALGCQLRAFDLRYPGIVRYPAALALTLATFVKERPSLIFAQNPSMILSAFAVLYGRVLGIPVIVDAHNAAIEPLWRTPRWQAALARFILRWATLTIVSNESLATSVRAEPRAGAVAALADPIPNLMRPAKVPSLKGRRNILYICSWAEDEPYREAIEAARLLPSDVCVYISGRSGNRLENVQLPPNVILTGYVDEETYVGMLYACDLILDLTTWQDCLLCGAYEAVSAERPMVLSGTVALRAYFDKGAVYTDNTPEDLARCIEEALSGTGTLTRDVGILRQQLIRDWEQSRAALEENLRRLTLPQA